MNRTGPAPTPRGFQAFGQPNPSARNLPLGSGRLQNTNKLVNHGVTACYTTRSLVRRPRVSSISSLTIFTRSEFPSLSGAPQTQYQNPGQAVWGNSNQRATQQTPVQRPQQQHPISQQSNSQQQNQQPSQSQEQSQQSREQLYSGSQMSGSNDDYHRGGQGGIGQLGASAQPHSNSIDEFPPLRRNGTDEDQQDRRGSLMQTAAFGGYSASNNFSMPLTQESARHRLPSAQSGRPDSRTSTLIERIRSPSSLSFNTPDLSRQPAKQYQFSPRQLRQPTATNRIITKHSVPAPTTTATIPPPTRFPSIRRRRPNRRKRPR
ncbi:MAG: hypothetical protein Q9180_006238 [Flavoplaca navasiana]